MSTKETHVLDFWWRKLADCVEWNGRGVSAGELAAYVGQSRSTAMRYLKKMVAHHGAESGTFRHFNGTMATRYYPKEQNSI